MTGASVDGADGSSARRFFERVGNFNHLVLALSGGKGAGLPSPHSI